MFSYVCLFSFPNMNDFTWQANSKLAIKVKKVKDVKNVKKSKSHQPATSQLAIKDKKVKKSKSQPPAAKSKSQPPAASSSMLQSQRASLLYKPAGQLNKPRFYGSVTVYTSIPDKCWRVKPGKGRRDEKLFKNHTNPRCAWDELVKHVKSLPQL